MTAPWPVFTRPVPLSRRTTSAGTTTLCNPAKVVLSLYGPKGELRGALLEGGTSLRMPPHAATELTAYLTPGAYVQAWGQGVKNRFGSTIEVEEIAYLVDEGSGP